MHTLFVTISKNVKVVIELSLAHIPYFKYNYSEFLIHVVIVKG